MSKTQRNWVFEAVASARLDASGCDFDNDEGLFSIIHKATNSKFDIYVDNDGNYRIWETIGDEPEPENECSVGTFRAVEESVADWARRVIAWEEIPDLWELNQSGESFVPGDNTPASGNTPFTTDERLTISSQLKEIAKSIKKTYELTADQSAEIDKKFEEAEKASQRMGRKDWGTFFGGIIFSLILADIITPGIAGHILIMIEHGLGHLFSGPAVGGVLSAGQD